MFYYILDTEFKSVMLIDSFESTIWTDRYREEGDFEVFLFPSKEIIANAKDDYYLYNPSSEHLMIIERQEITTDVEEGARFIVTGHSLESILKRRIVWSQTTISGSLQNGIKKLIDENIINPEVEARKISNFVFKESRDTAITKLKHEQQYTGDILYDVIKNLCELYDIGFKIIYNFETGNFEFSLYKGTDRSYNQNRNPYVIFSPNYENIINSDYTHGIEDYKNVTRIGGEGTGVDRVMADYGTASGLTRREIFTDARDVSKKNDDGTQLSDDEYTNLLQQRGKEKLSEYIIKEGFEGEVEASKMFVYGQDFFLGDCVQVENEFGISGTSLVSEIVFSQDESGETIYPTFVSLDNTTPSDDDTVYVRNELLVFDKEQTMESDYIVLSNTITASVKDEYILFGDDASEETGDE